MRRADRLFQIIQFLRSRRVTTASWLADRLEVSERTIYRDIKDLMLSGVNIEGEAGVGYVVRKGFDLPPLMFSEEEINALTLGARIVESWVDQSLATAAQSALSKIQMALPKDRQGSLDNTLLFSPFSRISQKDSNIMADIRFAADHRKKVQVRYQRADGEVSERVIWVLGLFFWGAVWTVGAWCEKRHAFRIFRLDRIARLIILQEDYPVKQGRTLQDLIENQQQETCDWPSDS